MKEKKFGIVAAIFLVLIGYLLSSIVSLLCLVPFLPVFGPLGGEAISLFHAFVMCLLNSVYYYRLSKGKRFNPVVIHVNIGYVLLVCVCFTICFVIAQASLLHPLMSIGVILAAPFFPSYIMISLFAGSYPVMATVGITLVYTLCFTLLLTRQFKKVTAAVVCVACAAICLFTYLQSPHYKYKDQDHGFAYMNGYSSTDLSAYTPYSESGKLAVLDHKPEFVITDPAEMPVLDGAEACYPVYSAVAKALYQDIDAIEKEYVEASMWENGSIVTFYNTAIGFDRLIGGEVDMFFGAKPSRSQLEQAESAGVELQYTVIGREAFVFFVREDNPVEALTGDQIRSIYHGEITNWKEVGGKNEKIIAFQRPERSGSQSMMMHFMGDVSLKEPMTHEMEYAMGGIVEEVVEYQNEAGAIGYSFRYFLEGLNEVEGVKMLSVDGVYPTADTIRDGTYPVTVPLYCITAKGNDNKNVQKVLEFLLSEDGQSLIEQTGYSPVR